MFKRCHAVLPVTELDPVIKFYEECLGFTLMATHQEGGELEWCRLRSGRADVMFYSPAASGDPEPECTDWAKVRLYFVVDELESLRAILLARHCAPSEIASTAYGMYEFDIIDPSGYRLTFAEAITQD